jgi:hypothetical protein
MAAGTTGFSGAASGCAVQRSPLPRIHIAGASVRSSSSVASGSGPNRQ